MALRTGGSYIESLFNLTPNIVAGMKLVRERKIKYI